MVIQQATPKLGGVKRQSFCSSYNFMGPEIRQLTERMAWNSKMAWVCFAVADTSARVVSER